MMDQLALYRIAPDELERLRTGDFILDREMVEAVERRARFVSDLFLDGASVGDLLGGLATILGAPVDGLVGRAGLALEPSGPVVWISHVPEDTRALIVKALAKARRLLGDPSDEPPVAERLRQLAEGFGGPNPTSNAIARIQRLVEGARGDGQLLAVFTRFR